MILEKNIYKAENIIIEYSKITNSNFKISNKKISIIKSNLLGNLKSAEFIDLANKLKNEDEEFIIKSIDVSYEYRNKKSNNDEESAKREEKILLIGTKTSLKELNYNLNNEFFIDITFKVLAQKFNHIK